MKSHLAIGLAALALLGACSKPGGASQDAASAGPGASSDGGDQKITLAQFQQRRVERIMRDDTDHDGKVSKDEFIQALQARLAERNDGAGDDSGNAPDPQAIADRVFPRMDVNGDGFIAKDEVEKSSAEQFATLDTSHKGYITRDEMRARFARSRGGGQGGADNGGGGGGGGG